MIAFLFRVYAKAVQAHMDDIASDRDHWRSIAETLLGQANRVIDVQAKALK